jgi:lysophospholipid acyltransferase (LPLAT)-like uncharacterized protein
MKKKLKHFIRHSIMPPCVAFLGKLFIGLIFRTCKVHLVGLDTYIETAQQKKCILMLWHNRLTIVAEILTRYTPLSYTALISNSRDGEPLALLAQSYKARTLRVPHNARYSALRKLVQHIKTQDDVVIITPDGPRGPAYQAKPGIFIAAKEADAEIIQLDWEASRFWELNTWDKMRIPKPFASIKVTFTTYKA